MNEKLDTPFTSIPEIMNCGRFMPLAEKLMIRRRVMQEKQAKQAEEVNYPVDVSKLEKNLYCGTPLLVKRLEKAAGTFNYATHIRNKEKQSVNEISIASPEQEKDFLEEDKESYLRSKKHAKGKSLVSLSQ
jgi:hypothetical protein